jgi:hypothetical protein
MIYPFVLATASLFDFERGQAMKWCWQMASPPPFLLLSSLLTRSIDMNSLPQASENR